MKDVDHASLFGGGHVAAAAAAAAGDVRGLALAQLLQQQREVPAQAGGGHQRGRVPQPQDRHTR